MRGPPIESVLAAIAFLQQLEIEAIGVGTGWVLRGAGVRNLDWELTLDDDEQLLDHARWERDLWQRLHDCQGSANPTTACPPVSALLRRGRQTSLEEWAPAAGEDTYKEVRK